MVYTMCEVHNASVMREVTVFLLRTMVLFMSFLAVSCPFVLQFLRVWDGTRNPEVELNDASALRF